MPATSAKRLGDVTALHLVAEARPAGHSQRQGGDHDQPGQQDERPPGLDEALDVEAAAAAGGHLGDRGRRHLHPQRHAALLRGVDHALGEPRRQRRGAVDAPLHAHDEGRDPR